VALQEECARAHGTIRPHPAKGIIAAQGRHLYEVAGQVGLNPNMFGAVLNRRFPVPAWLPDRLAAVLGVDAAGLFDESTQVAG